MLDGLLSEPRRTFVQLLEFDGEDLRGSPLTARKAVLAWLLRGSAFVLPPSSRR
jgi:ATP-dependent DNA ligase